MSDADSSERDSTDLRPEEAGEGLFTSLSGGLRRFDLKILYSSLLRWPEERLETGTGNKIREYIGLATGSPEEGRKLTVGFPWLQSVPGFHDSLHGFRLPLRSDARASESLRGSLEATVIFNGALELEDMEFALECLKDPRGEDHDNLVIARSRFLEYRPRIMACQTFSCSFQDRGLLSVTFGQGQKKEEKEEKEEEKKKKKKKKEEKEEEEEEKKEKREKKEEKRKERKKWEAPRLLGVDSRMENGWNRQGGGPLRKKKRKKKEEEEKEKERKGQTQERRIDGPRRDGLMDLGEVREYLEDWNSADGGSEFKRTLDLWLEASQILLSRICLGPEASCLLRLEGDERKVAPG